MKPSRPKLSISFLAMLACALIMGCARPASINHQRIVVAVGGEPAEGYDPVMGWGGSGSSLFFSTLLTRDAALNTEPDLARSWTLSDDRRTWTIVIRDDVRFSTGRKLTAHDVAYTFAQAARAGGLANVQNLESAEAPDDVTVRLTLRSPRLTFVDTFYTLGIVPADQYVPGFGRAPVGSGPFRLVHWDEGQQLIIEPNPLYYGEPSPFQRITFLFSSEDASYTAAQGGGIALLSASPALANRAPAQMHAIAVESVDNRGLMFPMQPEKGRTTRDSAPIGNSVTSDRAVRAAINMAIDRRTLVRTALHGYGSPAYGPADSLAWSNAEERVEDNNMAAAKEILTRAGWREIPGHAARRKNGVEARIRILYFADDSLRQALALLVAEQLRPLGVVVDVEGRSREDVRRLMHANVVLFGFGSHSASEIEALFASSSSGRGMANAGYYANPTVDGYIASAQASRTPEEANAFWRRSQWDGATGYGVHGDATWAWLVNLQHVYFVHDCLDIGATQIEPHGHGWPITSGIARWRWTCP